MPVFALYNFDDAATSAADSALGNGAQDGTYLNGATAVGGQAVLDGENDLIKIYPSPEFQMDTGTLDIRFTLSDAALTDTQTILSRDSIGQTAGGYRIEVLADGSVLVSSETDTGTETITTGPGFAAPDDAISLSYSWDLGGAGGALQIDNATSGTDFSADVPNTVGMDMGDVNQPWIVGAGQASSTPDLRDNIDQHFGGTVEVFSLSDTVDNVVDNADPQANPDEAITDEDVPVEIDVLLNDSDPEGGPLTLTGGDAPNGTVTVTPEGTLIYSPNQDFNGTDTITYTIHDADGNTDSATVTVTVNPVNDAPVAVDDTGATLVGVPVTLNVISNDTDVDGDPLSLLGVPVSDDGTVVDNGDGTITFTPNDGFTGTALITYTVTDGNGGTDEGEVAVTVSEADPTRDGIVRGTTGNDLIDVAYTGDTDGDMVDAADAILGDDAPNDDRILAGDGDDTVRAGLGDDSIEGGRGDDNISAGAGDDTIYGGSGDDTLLGRGGDDDIYGGGGSDSARGGAGDDLIDTRGGLNPVPLPDIDYPGVYPADTDPSDDLDTVYGGQGNDTILTGDDADVIFGGYGNDVIDSGIDDDTIQGNQGDDTITGSEGNDVINGGYGDDLIYGGLAPDVLEPLNIADDQGDLRPGNNGDSIRGGIGNDTIYGMDDADTIDGGQDDDALYGGIDNDSITGGSGADTITGGEGEDSLAGGGDRDVFLGGGAGDMVNGNEGGDDYDTLDLTGAGPLSIVYDPDNAENGVVTFRDDDGNATGTMAFVNIENVIPCFTPGTMIATPRGEVAVETLRQGDKIITRDNGIQEIRWVGHKDMSWRDLAANPHLKPVLVRQGSLGNGLPERDMMVSPNHRLLVANDRTALYFDEHEVLVAAKHLVSTQGVHSVDSMGTSYIHFMFDRHEVVLSNGAWTESFQPGDYTLRGMGNAQRAEIFDLFPELKTEPGLENYSAARRTLRRHEAALLAR